MAEKKADSSAINQLARQLFAMGQKRKPTDLAASMDAERYQRTFTDEMYPQKPRPGFREVDPEQKAMWAKLAARD